MKNVVTTNFNKFKNYFCIKYKGTYAILLVNKKKFFILGNSVNNKFNKGVYINDETKVISCNTYLNNQQLYKNNYNLNLYFTKYFDVFFSKIKFIGKGFRIQYFKRKKVLNFTFGHSHMYMMYIQKLFLKKINKFKYFYKTTNLKHLQWLNNQFKKIKPINKYTLRGLRIHKTTITKRKGRKSPNL